MAEAVGLGSHRAMAAEKYGTERRPEKPGEVAKPQGPQGAVTARGPESYKGFLGGGFKHDLFSPLLGEMIHFD